MAQLKVNTFTEYQFSGAEHISASCLTDLQTQLLQSDLSTVAQQMLSLEYNSQNPVVFAQEQAYLKGQLELLQHLIERSDTAKKVSLELAQSEGSNNSGISEIINPFSSPLDPKHF